MAIVDALPSAPGRPATVCPQGHRYTPDNTYLEKGGKVKRCKKCRNMQSTEWARQNPERMAEYRRGTKNLAISVSAELKDRITAARGSVPESRFIRNILEARCPA